MRWFDIPGRGYTFGQTTRFGQIHDGLDILTPTGTPITSLIDGTVGGETGHHPYGWRVDVLGTLPDGRAANVITVHLDSIAVSLGEHVSRGQLLGSSGGENLPPIYSTGPHTHLGVFVNGVAIDPAPILDEVRQAMDLTPFYAPITRQDGSQWFRDTRTGQECFQGFYDFLSELGDTRPLIQGAQMVPGTPDSYILNEAPDGGAGDVTVWVAASNTATRAYGAYVVRHILAAQAQEEAHEAGGLSGTDTAGLRVQLAETAQTLSREAAAVTALLNSLPARG